MCYSVCLLWAACSKSYLLAVGTICFSTLLCVSCPTVAPQRTGPSSRCHYLSDCQTSSLFSQGTSFPLLLFTQGEKYTWSLAIIFFSSCLDGPKDRNLNDVWGLFGWWFSLDISESPQALAPIHYIYLSPIFDEHLSYNLLSRFYEVFLSFLLLSLSFKCSHWVTHWWKHVFPHTHKNTLFLCSCSKTHTLERH